MLLVLFSALLGAGAVEWTWRAPPGCPDEASSRRRFEQQAQDHCTLAGEEDAPLRIDAVVAARGRRFDLELRLGRGDRTLVRSLSARSCEALADAAAVIAATACPELTPRARPVDRPIDAGVPGALEVPAPTVAVAPPRPPAAVADTRPAAVARVRPARALVLRLGPAWGPTPTPALTIGGGVSLRWRRFVLLAALDVTTRRLVRAAEDPRVGIEIRMLGASIAAGPGAWGRGRTRGHGAVLASFEGAAMLGTGVGTQNTRTGAQPWLAVALGPRLSWRPSSNVGASLQADVAASLLQPAFRVDGYEAAFRAAAWAVRLRMSLDFELR